MNKEQYTPFTDDREKIPESPENPPPLRVCPRCLMAIESREGRQFTRPVYFDDDEPARCEWCEDDENDVLYEFL